MFVSHCDPYGIVAIFLGCVLSLRLQHLFHSAHNGFQSGVWEGPSKTGRLCQGQLWDDLLIHMTGRAGAGHGPALLSVLASPRAA